MSALTYKYFPKVSEREENLFVEEYYCSTDTKILMDDIEQTEIAYINYVMQEQLKPLYGYASNTFDDVAIGNRIVTGMFKVPIKNPEGQTTLEDVLAEADTFNEDVSGVYNDTQDELRDSIEWIDNKKKELAESSSGNSTYSDEQLKYIGELISLGYDVEYGSSEYDVKKAIKAFQIANNCTSTDGELTEETKQKIDAAYDILNDDNGETVTIPAGTLLYIGPGSEYSYETIEDPIKAILMDECDGYIYAVLSDGRSGYIKKGVV